MLCLFAAGMATMTPLHTSGQASATTPKPQDATTQPPAFEVASIKPNKSGSGSSHSGFDDGRFTATNIQLKTLLQYDAYEIPGPQILGGPGWLSSERFDIEAKVDDTVANQLKTLGRDQGNLLRKLLVQQLLADRFKLAVHWETKELPVYALVVAKNGPKFRKSKDIKDGTSISSGNGRYTAQGVTMAKLAQSLTQVLARELGRIIIDKTSIEGKFDLAFTWTPENGSAAMVNTSNETSAPPGPSIFTALQEQLGLKLESTRGPVETLVIDHIEEPSAN
jgi:uncharacterized protein (TIGR03435 family)